MSSTAILFEIVFEAKTPNLELKCLENVSKILDIVLALRQLDKFTMCHLYLPVVFYA